MLAVLMPSRGLVHSRTMEDLIEVLSGHDYELFMSHGLPIPEAQNILTEQALVTDASHFFYVEDDMQLPPWILPKLMTEDAEIVTADYPVRGNQHTVKYIDGKFAYAGLGCTLVARQVFEYRLEEPFFRVDTEYQIEDGKLWPQPARMGNYGLFDVDFYQRALKANCSVKVIDTPVGQYFLKKPELPKYYNNSASEYEVETWSFGLNASKK